MRQLQWDQDLARLVKLLRILVELVTTAGAATLADQQTFDSLILILSSNYLLSESSV